MSQQKTNESCETANLAGFGTRLREAFEGAKNVQIARELAVTEAAVRNYLDGRVPAAETLVLISERTKCSIDWLLTGRGSKFGGVDLRGSQLLTEVEEQAVRELAAEAAEGYEDTLRRIVRERLRTLGKLPVEVAPLRLAYYGSEWVEVPLVGIVAAGSPIETFEYREVARVLKTWPDSETAYALRVSGDSMVDDDIHDGDVIVCLEASEARRGQLIIALIDGEKATVKRFYRDNGTVILKPASAAHEPLEYEAGRVRIQGRVESIIHCAKDIS